MYRAAHGWTGVLDLEFWVSGRHLQEDWGIMVPCRKEYIESFQRRTAMSGDEM